jgi:hypothetical protein
MRLSSHGPRARLAFRRLVLQSQIGLYEAELADLESRRHRLRARRAERRLVELRALLGDLDGLERAPRRSRLGSRGLGYLVSAAWLVGAGGLGIELARHGLHTTTATVGNVVMLVVSLLWFALAVARLPLSGAERPEQSPRREPPS